MLLIFENPDKTGKSTLAKRLAHDLEIPYVKLNNISVVEDTSISDGVSISTHSQLETVTQLYEKDVIKAAVLDRFHPSEYVYSKVFERAYNTSYINEIEERLSKYDNVYLIRTECSYPTLIKRWKDEKLVDNSLINKVVKEYENFYNQTKLNIITVNTSVDENTSYMFLLSELFKRGIYKGHLKPKRWSHVQAMMNVAKDISRRSPDLSRQVGCVITENGYIIAASYNGPPSGMKHDEICPRREAGFKSGEALDMSRAVHAEQNALLQTGLRFNRKDADLVLFSTDQPCIHCMRMCIQAGIKKIYYINPYPHKLALEMANEAGVELIQWKE